MTEVNSQGRPKQKRKLKLRSAVWDHFTPSVEGIAQCNHCPSGLNGTHGTKSLWKHLVNHFTTRIDEQRDRKGIVRCNICQMEFEVGDETMENHVKGCIEQDTAAAVEASQPPPPVQTRAPSGSGEEQDAAAAVGAEPPVQVQSRAPLGSGESSMDTEPAGLDQAKASRDLARMIALGGYDPSIVENDYFKSFVRHLDPRFEVPSRRAIEEMCNSVLDEAKDDFLYSWTRNTVAKPSFSLGVAKSTIKVHKYGSAVSQSIDVGRLSGYEELKLALARMFGIEAFQDRQRIGWELVYQDHEDDIFLVGDDPWEEFAGCVRCIRIIPPQVLQQCPVKPGLQQLRW